MDKTILKLQQEKFEIQKTKDQVYELKATSKEHNKELEETHEKIKEKLVDYQQLYDLELKTLNAGKKLNDWADEYLKSKNKRKLIDQFLKWIEMENAKKRQMSPDERKKEKIIANEIRKDLKKHKKTIQQQQFKIIEKKNIAAQKLIEQLKVGDRVKIKDSQSIGTILEIKNGTVTINYGQFTTKISIFEVYKI